MRQQPNELNNHYLGMFNSNVHTVGMAKGSHVLCPHELVECETGMDPTDEQIAKQEGHFQVHSFLA